MKYNDLFWYFDNAADFNDSEQITTFIPSLLCDKKWHNEFFGRGKSTSGASK